MRLFVENGVKTWSLTYLHLPLRKKNPVAAAEKMGGGVPFFNFCARCKSTVMRNMNSCDISNEGDVELICAQAKTNSHRGHLETVDLAR